MEPDFKSESRREEAPVEDAEPFLELAERFRSSQDANEIHRLGDELGRSVFGK